MNFLIDPVDEPGPPSPRPGYRVAWVRARMRRVRLIGGAPKRAFPCGGPQEMQIHRCCLRRYGRATRIGPSLRELSSRCAVRLAGSGDRPLGARGQATWNPSNWAARANRASPVTNVCDSGCISKAIKTAANCSALAARSGWTRIIRPAVARTCSEGAISCQDEENRSNRRLAKSNSSLERIRSRQRPARADSHSSRLPHQVAIVGLFRNIDLRFELADSSTRRATRADASQ